MRNCVKGPGKYGRSQYDMFGGMCVTVPRESAGTQFALLGRMGVKQRCVAKFGWGCANGENKKTSSNLSTLPKKQPKS